MGKKKFKQSNFALYPVKKHGKGKKIIEINVLLHSSFPSQIYLVNYIELLKNYNIIY